MTNPKTGDNVLIAGIQLYWYGIVKETDDERRIARVFYRVYQEGFDPFVETEKRLPCPNCGSIYRSCNLMTDEIECGICDQRLTQEKEEEFAYDQLTIAVLEA